jgi:hypothetical protein
MHRAARRNAMDASDLRKLILSDHSRIRRKLRDIRRVRNAISRGDMRAKHQLRAQALELVTLFLTHLKSEDVLLVPVLRDIDAWGPIRASRVEREHEEQRSEMSALTDTVEVGTTLELCRALEAITHKLLEDMDGEERLVLSAELLRDDPVAIDQVDG